MGLVWWLVPTAAAAIGAFTILRGVVHLFRGHVARSGSHLVGGIILAAAGLALGLVGVNVQLFSRFTHEGPVALVSVKSLDGARNFYRVSIARLDGSIPTQSCAIQGDEWIIGGRVQKWKAWATILGMNATYTLDQVSNKYFTAARGNGKPITSCDLTGTPEVNELVPPDWLPWLLARFYAEDRRFGSANYMPLADGARYEILITQSGFNAEPANGVARAAVAALR